SRLSISMAAASTRCWPARNKGKAGLQSGLLVLIVDHLRDLRGAYHSRVFLVLPITKKLVWRRPYRHSARQHFENTGAA
ncbi:MAG: hypothetical protein V4602_13060, partial [Pseudomonadota bacterium]